MRKLWVEKEKSSPRTGMKIAVAGLVAIIVCVTTQVIGRYVFKDTPTWPEALALLLVTYIPGFSLWLPRIAIGYGGWLDFPDWRGRIAAGHL